MAKKAAKKVTKKAKPQKTAKAKPKQKNSKAEAKKKVPSKAIKKNLAKKPGKILAKKTTKKIIIKSAKKIKPAKKVKIKTPKKLSSAKKVNQKKIVKKVQPPKKVQAIKPSKKAAITEEKIEHKKSSSILTKNTIEQITSSKKSENSNHVKINNNIKKKIKFNIDELPKMRSYTKSKTGEFSIEDKLKALYDLQQIDSTVDKIKVVRGELPVEVNDLEDEIAGLETRIKNYSEEVNQLEDQIVKKKQFIKDANAAIKKYAAQQSNVKNNREYDSLSKEIEFQNLEIQLAEKRIKEYTTEIASKNSMIEAADQTLKERKNGLQQKKAELDGIVAETKKDEDILIQRSKEAATVIEDRLLSAYQRIRENANNGLAVVTIQRDSCGGCFNKIPPQRQLDIKQRKKIIICEHCGRILVDSEIVN